MSVVVKLRVATELRDEWMSVATERGVTLSALIRSVMEEGLAQVREPASPPAPRVSPSPAAQVVRDGPRAKAKLGDPCPHCGVTHLSWLMACPAAQADLK